MKLRDIIDEIKLIRGKLKVKNVGMMGVYMMFPHKSWDDSYYVSKADDKFIYLHYNNSSPNDIRIYDELIKNLEAYGIKYYVDIVPWAHYQPYAPERILADRTVRIPMNYIEVIGKLKFLD